MRKVLMLVGSFVIMVCTGTFAPAKSELPQDSEPVAVFDKKIVQMVPVVNNSAIVLRKDGQLVFWSAKDNSQTILCEDMLRHSGLGGYAVWDVSDNGEILAFIDPKSGLVIKKLTDISGFPEAVLNILELIPEKMIITNIKVSNSGRYAALLERGKRNGKFKVVLVEGRSKKKQYLPIEFEYTGEANTVTPYEGREFDIPFLGGFSLDEKTLLVSRSRRQSFPTESDTMTNYFYADLYLYDIPSGKTYAATGQMDAFRRADLVRDWMCCSDCFLSGSSMLSAIRFRKGVMAPESEVLGDWEKLVADSAEKKYLRERPGLRVPSQQVTAPAVLAQRLFEQQLFADQEPCPGCYSRVEFKEVLREAMGDSVVSGFKMALSPDAKNYLMIYPKSCWFGRMGGKNMEMKEAAECSFALDGKYVYYVNDKKISKVSVAKLVEALPGEPSAQSVQAAEDDSAEISVTETKGNEQASASVPEKQSEPEDAHGTEVAEQGDDSDLTLKRADAYTAQKDYKNASANYDAALKIMPEGDARKVYVLERQGMLLLKQKNTVKAKGFYLAAVKTAKELNVTDKNAVNSYLGLAQCLEKGGNTPAAVKNYKKALELTTNNKIRQKIQKTLQRLTTDSK